MRTHMFYVGEEMLEREEGEENSWEQEREYDVGFTYNEGGEERDDLGKGRESEEMGGIRSRQIFRF